MASDREAALRAAQGAAGAGLSRCSLFKKTLGTAVLLAAAGAVPLALRKTRLREVPAGRTLAFFTAAEYSIMAAVAERVLAETVPPALAASPPGGAAAIPAVLAPALAALPPAPTPAQLDVAGHIDAFLAPSDPAVAKDFKQLLALFDNSLFSLLGGGPPRPFTQMSAEDQDRHLARWAHSRLAVQRSGYQALKRLAGAIYFGSPETFASLGYPGPPYELVRAVNEARDAAKREAAQAAPANSAAPGATPANAASANPASPDTAPRNPAPPNPATPSATPAAAPGGAR